LGNEPYPDDAGPGLDGQKCVSVHDQTECPVLIFIASKPATKIANFGVAPQIMQVKALPTMFPKAKQVSKLLPNGKNIGVAPQITQAGSFPTLMNAKMSSSNAMPMKMTNTRVMPHIINRARVLPTLLNPRVSSPKRKSNNVAPKKKFKSGKGLPASLMAKKLSKKSIKNPLKKSAKRAPKKPDKKPTKITVQIISKKSAKKADKKATALPAKNPSVKSVVNPTEKASTSKKSGKKPCKIPGHGVRPVAFIPSKNYKGHIKHNVPSKKGKPAILLAPKTPSSKKKVVDRPSKKCKHKVKASKKTSRNGKLLSIAKALLKKKKGSGVEPEVVILPKNGKLHKNKKSSRKGKSEGQLAALLTAKVPSKKKKSPVIQPVAVRAPHKNVPHTSKATSKKVKQVKAPPALKSKSSSKSPNLAKSLTDFLKPKASSKMENTSPKIFKIKALAPKKGGLGSKLKKTINPTIVKPKKNVVKAKLGPQTSKKLSVTPFAREAAPTTKKVVKPSLKTTKLRIDPKKKPKVSPFAKEAAVVMKRKIVNIVNPRK
jgi:hypothetical protein